MKLKILMFACSLLLILACEKESALDKYYNQPANFSGSIYEALDSTGLYSYFIRAIDSTDFANQLKNTLVTVVAPTDKAFQAYLEKYNYDSLSSIPQEVLEDLIGNHIITWPHSPSSLEVEPVWFKRLTNMAQRTVTKYDEVSQADIEIVSEAKYLQFYYPRMLIEYGATANDYTLLAGTELAPGTEYNLNNVQVDTIIPYGNGWVYYVDQLIEPIQNLDDWLMYSPDYSVFNSLFNRFATYGIDNNVNRSVPVKRSNLYQNNRTYRIDMELCFETVGYQKDGGSYISLNGSSGFTVFAPKNNAMESFIDTYFDEYPGFKDSIFIIDRASVENLHIGKIVRAMIKPYMFIDQPFFPSSFLSAEGIYGGDGTNLKFEEQDVAEYNLASNGYGYGLNTYEVPRTFKSILNPAFTTPSYKYFAAAVEAAGIFYYLNNMNADFTLMLPTDEAFIKNSILLVDEATWVSEYGGAFSTWGLSETVFMDIDPLNPNAPERIEVQDLFDLVFNHLFEEPISPSSQKQYAVNAPGRYVGITQDSVWSGGNIYVEPGSRTVVPKIVKTIDASNTDNGRVYVIDDLIQSPKYPVGDIISINPAFSRFKELCENAGLYAGDGSLSIFGNSPTVFIPTNAAIDQYILDGNLPTDVLGLQSFIKYHFLDRTVFTSETINETIATLSKDEELSTEFKNVYRTVELNGTYENLNVKGKENPSFFNVEEGDVSNIICTDGIIHQIDGVLN